MRKSLGSRYVIGVFEEGISLRQSSSSRIAEMEECEVQEEETESRISGRCITGRKVWRESRGICYEEYSFWSTFLGI